MRHFRARFLIFAITSTWMATPAYAAKKTPLELQPSSKWHVNYADDLCRLSRIFGADKNKTVLYIERYQPGDEFFMVVAGKPLGKSPRKSTDFIFGPNGKSLEDQTNNGDLGDYGPAVLVSGATILPVSTSDDKAISKKNFDPEKYASNTDIFGQELTPEDEARIEWLDIHPRGKKAVRLKLGPMDKPLAVLRQCTDELLSHWGLDLEELRGMTRGPVPTKSPSTWIRSTDYPNSALRKGHQAILRFRLLIGADGKPRSCHIQQKTNPEGFKDIVCERLMKRAKFEPALGADGQPIASYYGNGVRFQIRQ